jgi:uncharacterized SAM-binding protein YcdF (DUF218 family)
MAVYATDKGLPATKILKETISLDTVANLYYLKKMVFKPHGLHRILLVTADFRALRITFLWQKVLGPDYPLTIETVPFDQNNTYTHDLEILARQQEWLKDVRDGDDAWFRDKFYNDPYYTAAKIADKVQLKNGA